MAAELPPVLHQLLTASLPRNSSFTFHYLSSTPTECDSIFAAPPGAPPEPTTWESQLLSISIQHQDGLVQVFAIEALIYTTARLITIFVSKADSTGYLHLANLPKTSNSPIRIIASAFLEYLVAWKRGSRQLVLSLFARAQAQYLFPGSIENSGKHVLDDRQLIRWWCRIVDDVLAKVEASTQTNGTTAPSNEAVDRANLQAYLVIPGLDAHEIRTYIPHPSSRWVTAHSPLGLLAAAPDVPERCLIPRFPDDPKARFAIDLDDELPENAIQPADAAEAPVPSETGKWRSVRSLEQFWELMAFRQECAAGRVVGFLWALFAPLTTETSEPEARVTATETTEAVSTNGTSQADPKHTPPEKSNTQGEAKAHLASPSPSPPQPSSVPAPADAKEPSSPSGVDPQPPSDPDTASVPPLPAPDVPPTEPLPPTDPPTALRVPSAKYTTITTLLDRLDYADVAIAKISSGRFLEHAAEQAGLSTGLDGWGVEVHGTRMDQDAPKTDQRATTVAVPTMLVGRKRKKEKVVDEDQVEKKAKVDE